MRTRSILLASCLALGGCHGAGGDGRLDASEDASEDATRRAPGEPPPVLGDAAVEATGTAALDDRLLAILRAEQTRNANAISSLDQQSRDVAVRRAAARALSRIGGPESRAGLFRALADEDAGVVLWAAYGLGFSCKGHEKETVSALVARALSLPPTRDAGNAGDPKSLEAPMTTIARAIGQCGAEESEPTLVAWLSGPPSWVTAATLALGDVAVQKQRLREETLASLLNVAAGSAARPPSTAALFAPSRLDRVPLTVVARLREVATARLGAAEDARLFAVRALARAGEESAPELGRVLATPASFSPAERAEAARGLGKLGHAGQLALAAALPDVVPGRDPAALAALMGEGFGVVLTAVEQIVDPKVAKAQLGDLASLAPPDGAAAPLLRRISSLRCAAAKTLASASFKDRALAACDVTDPAGGRAIGGRAMVEVLGRDALTGPRLVAFQERLHDGDVRVREAALELLEKHDEVEGSAAMLAEALAAKESGVMATAAEVLAKQPARATEGHVSGAAHPPARPPPRRRGKKKVDLDVVTATAAQSPALVKALLEALARPAIDADPEAATSLIDATGALGLGDAKARLTELCGSPYPTTREHAQKALALVGERRSCDAPAGGGPVPAELDHLERSPVIVALETDAGPLTLELDPTFAPVAVTRFADLVRAGFYDGRRVHRVVSGFVAQLGAPHDDGFGGPEGKPALRCETSPIGFAPMSIGVALAGRDTGASQLFVMQGRYPHLDGRYAWIGAATGPWAALADGDVIVKATIRAR